MTPAARMQAAIDVLDDWAPGRQADRLLLAWGRANRYAGPKDRAAVADHVYDALRRWRSLAWPDVAGGGRARPLSLAAEAEALAGWTGERHAPAPPGEAEMAALQADLDAAPEGVRLDRTVFYPTGGGQPGDSGTLTLPDGSVLRVVDAVKGETHEDVVHVLEDGAPPPAPGTKVTAAIDWDRRHRQNRVRCGGGRLWSSCRPSDDVVHEIHAWSLDRGHRSGGGLGLSHGVARRCDRADHWL